MLSSMYGRITIPFMPCVLSLHKPADGNNVCEECFERDIENRILVVR